MKGSKDNRGRLDAVSLVGEFSQGTRNVRTTRDALSLAPGFSRVYGAVNLGETVLTVSRIAKA